MAGISVFGVLYNHNKTISSTTSISEDVDSKAKGGEIDINVGAVALNIDSGGDKFVSGKADTLSGVNVTDSMEGETQKLKIDQIPDRAIFWGRNTKNTLDVDVTKNLPLDIKINAGATKIDADLSKSMIKTLEIDSGATSADIKIGDKSNYAKINISCGASSFDIRVPDDYSLKVTNKSGLSGNNLSSLNLIKNGEEWTSSDYNTNDKKIDILFESGASSLNISRY